MSDDDHRIRIEVVGAVATLVVSRPDRANAWQSDMWQQATAHMRTISAQPSVRAIAIDSEGDRVFSAGADLFELADLAGRRSDLAHMLNGIEEFSRSVEAAPQPVVAVMTGAALGAGLEIAAAADIRVAFDAVGLRSSRGPARRRHHAYRRVAPGPCIRVSRGVRFASDRTDTECRRGSPAGLPVVGVCPR